MENKLASEWITMIQETIEKYGDFELQVRLVSKTMIGGIVVKQSHYGINPNKIIVFDKEGYGDMILEHM